MEHRKNFISDQESLRIYFHTPLYSVFSLTWPASMQIYWNKRKRLHKERVQLPQDWFGTQTWPPFHCFGTQISPPWHDVKTYNNDNIFIPLWLVDITYLISFFENVSSFRMPQNNPFTSNVFNHGRTRGKDTFTL